MPDANIILGVSNISFGLNPGGTRRAQFGVSARLRRSRDEFGDRKCFEDPAADAVSTSTRSTPLAILIYDRRKFDGDVCTYDPLGEFTTMFDGQIGTVDQAGHLESADRRKAQSITSSTANASGSKIR